MAENKRRRGHRKASAWSLGLVVNAEGLTFKDVARAQLRLINSGRQQLKRCGAAAKSTGEPCKQAAMGNGRCRFHGGKTPSGDNWHVVQPNVSGHKTSMDRFSRKLVRVEKAEKARRQRLRIGTDEERAAYEKWLWSHPHGSEKRRAARRLDKRISAQERILPKVADMMVDEETQALIDRIAELKARRANLEAHISGVFS